jgi:hypothetical protein
MSEYDPLDGQLTSAMRKKPPLQQIEDTVFFALFSLRKKKHLLIPNRYITWAQVLVLWIHLAGFILGSAEHFGPLTQAYAQVIVFLQFRSPEITSPTRFGFMVAFWILFSFCVGLVALLGLVMHSYTQLSYRLAWPMVVVNGLTTLLFKYLTVFTFSVLLSPILCDLRSGPSVCFNSVTLPPLVVGVVILLLVIPYYLAYALVNVTLRHEPNELRSCVSSSFNVVTNLVVFLFVLQGQYFGKSYLLGSVWSMILYVTSLSLLWMVLLRKLPFHHEYTIQLYSGCLTSLIWLSLCGLFVEVTPGHSLGKNTAIDYLLPLGFLPAIYLGVVIARERLMVVQGWCLLVKNTLATPSLMNHPQFHANRLDESTPIGGGCPVMPNRRATVSHGTGSPASTADASGKLLKSPFLAGILDEPHLIEIIGRKLMLDKSMEAADAWNRAAISVHPNHVGVHYSYCHFTEVYRELNPNLANSLDTATVDTVASLNPSVTIRFLMFCRQMETEQKSSGATAPSGMDKLDLLQYVEFQRSFTEAKRYHTKCVDSIQQFWLLFVSTSVRFNTFEKSVRSIMDCSKRADEFYRTLLSRVRKFIDLFVCSMMVAISA